MVVLAVRTPEHLHQPWMIWWILSLEIDRPIAHYFAFFFPRFV